MKQLLTYLRAGILVLILSANPSFAQDTNVTRRDTTSRRDSVRQVRREEANYEIEYAGHMGDAMYGKK